MAPMQPSLGPSRDEPRVFGLDKFNGDNFAEWYFKMENIFDHHDLLEVMEGTEKRPENDPEKSPWVRKSAQGYLLLGQALGSSQIRHIKPLQREPEKGPKAWAALKGVHAPATAAVAVVLERQMAALRIEEEEAVEEGVHKFFDLLTRLEGADLNYSELQKKTKLLALLPESWSSLIINLNRDLPRLSHEVVKRAILQEDFRRRQEGRGAGGGRGRGRGGRGGRGGGAANLRNGDNESESRDDCFPGQFFFVSTQAPAAPEKDESFEERAAVGKVTLHSLDYWVIDSGATYSMTTQAEVKGMGKAKFKGADGKMVGLKNTARLGKWILWDLREDRDVYNDMWQIFVVPMPKERQVAASISTKGEAVGSGDGANGRTKEIESKKFNLGVTSKLGEHEESGAAAQKQHKGEENPKAAAEEEYGENMWGTFASAAFSNLTSGTGECDWLTLHRGMGHVALPILHQLVKNEMVAGIRVKGEPDEVLGCPTCLQAKFTRYPFSSSKATAKAPLDEVVMDVVTVSKEEISGVTEDGGEPEVEEQQQQQQQDAPQAVPEPKTLAEALSGPDAEKWKQSVKEEYDSLLENETWELCELPPWKKAISSKLIFRHKYGPDGELTRYKSRLVAKGFQQTKGKDFDEIFAPVGKGTTLRCVEEMLEMQFKCSKMGDVKYYLGMHVERDLDKGVLRLHQRKYCEGLAEKYGLQDGGKPASPLPSGFTVEPCADEEVVGESDRKLFHSMVYEEKEQFLMLLVYVDDILLFSKSSAMIEHVEEMLEMQFKCSKMGHVKYYLGMHVERDLDKGVLRLHQRKYCEGLAEKYGLQDGGKPASPLPSGFTVEPCADEEVVGESDRKLFHSMVGALNYAANHTRPDIAFATSRLASVVSRPSHEQLEAAKRLVRYVSATASVGLEYSAVRQRLQRGAADLGKGEMLLTCYTDASFNTVKADGTSIGGYVCLFGGGVVSWRSKKQNKVGQSLCETEYMALHHGAKEVVWLRRFLECARRSQL
ncbi:unnamed protein product [Closterium sp. NIES-53]